jgi:protein phosphatase
MKEQPGPFDIIGDVHGCADELRALLALLAYSPDEAGVWRHPEGRRMIFLGDLVDRGPLVVDVLRLVMGMVEAGAALCVQGNHDFRLGRKLNGRNVKVTNGLSETLAQLASEPWEFKLAVKSFLSRLPHHYILDDGKLVVAHAGLKESLHGSNSGAAQSFALYGDTTGEIDEFGFPVRRNWAKKYRGQAMVVYGHTPVPTPEWLNNTINIDTGCVFGGKLTALRYPERDIVSVPAAQCYAEPNRPLPLSDAEQV